MPVKALDALNQLYSRPEDCAPAIGLTYIRDGSPGFGRRRCGKGFTYSTPDGHAVSDKSLRQRLNQLAIPPAWKQVWISPDPKAHLQATGIDEAGRKQYLYHGEWQQFRNRIKFYHLIPFVECLPRLRRHALQEIRNCPPASAANVLAAMVLLLDKGALRIGNEVYFESNESVGLTTLLPEHLEVAGAGIRLRYTGKSGQSQDIQLKHAELAAVLETLRTQGGPRLFCYRGTDENFCTISADTVNQYLHAYSPCAISAKDFRTWKGTLLAYEQLLFAQAQKEPPALKTIVEAVSNALGNTPAVALSSYIHPDLISLWKAGEFSKYQQKVSQYKASAYLSRTEHQLQKLLEILFRKYMQPELPEAA